MTSPTPDSSSTASVSIFSKQWRTLTVGVVAIDSVIAFEAMGVVTAMPAAVSDLGGLSLYAWAFTTFVATTLFSTVVAGDWADRFGPMRALWIGAVLFAVGTGAAGLAPEMTTFLIGRAVQGLGSGAVIVAVYVLVGRAFPSEMRPRLFTALSGAWILPGLIGPAIAGVLADTLTWRWVFLGVLLLMVPIAVLLTPRLIVMELPGDTEARDQTSRARLAAMAAVGMALLQYAGQRLDLWSIPFAAVAVFLLVKGVPPLLPPGTLMFRRGLPTVIAERGMLAGAFFAAEAFIPLLLVDERNLASAIAGITISSSAIGWFIGSWYQGRPSTRVPRAGLVQLGCFMVALGIALTTFVVIPAVPTWTTIATWGTAAFGMGVVFASLSVLLLDLSPVADQGANSAALQVSDSLGAVICTAAAGVVFAVGHSASGTNPAVYVVILGATTALAGWATAIGRRVSPFPLGTSG